MNPRSDLNYTLDFGAVGYHDAKEPFCVTLSAEALEELIADGRRGWRVYELALIERPGDVWDYVRVAPQAVPERLRERIDRARVVAAAATLPGQPAQAWPEGQLPFCAFDEMFQPIWAWDPEALDEAWRGGWPASYAVRLHALARDSLSELSTSDPLIAYELRQIRERCHPWDRLSRSNALGRTRDSFHAPKPDRHTDGFYLELARLLGDPELVSVACRGQGDWRLLRLLCGEQRRRMEATGHPAQHSLFIGVSGDYDPAVGGWGCEVLWFSEGLSHGDLLIEDRPNGANIKELIERYRRRPQVVLADSKEVEIDGYQRTAGDGWARYDRVQPTTRRLRQEIIAARWSGDNQPILAFAESGISVYPHERALVVIGAEVDDEALRVIAEILSGWRTRGLAPLLLYDGPEARAAEAGLDVTNAFPLGDGLTALDMAAWVRDLPWIDGVLALFAPDAWIAAINDCILARPGPWATWVAATPDSGLRHVDQLISSDVASGFAQAAERARCAKPHRWLRP